jgi:hypothetical protein
MKSINVGDLVEDCINSYSGIVFKIETDGSDTWAYFVRRDKTLYGNRYGNETNRINTKNLRVLEPCPSPHVDPRIYDLYSKYQRLMEHLGLEETTIPEKTIIRIKKEKK